MFFTTLNALLATLANLTVSLTSNDDGTITVTVIPKGKKDGESALNTPLTLTGTAEELDAEFAAIVSNYSAKRLSLAEQLEATTSIMDAAKKEAATTATKAIKKAGKPDAVTPTSTQPKPDGDGDDDKEGEGDDKPASDDPKVTEALAPKAAAAVDENLFA